MKKKMVPLIIVLVVVIALFGAYYFYLKPLLENRGEPTTYDILSEVTYYSPGDYFVTNITGSTALAKTSVNLQLTSDETDFLSNNNAIVRNAIVKVLIAHPETEMRADSAIDMLESEMLQALRTATGLDEQIDKVIISDFVIQ